MDVLVKIVIIKIIKIEIVIILFSLLPFILGLIYKVWQKNKRNFVHWYVKIKNHYLPKDCGYKPFETETMEGFLFKKELISNLLSMYSRKKIRTSFSFVDKTFYTIKGYDISKMIGVGIKVLASFDGIFTSFVTEDIVFNHSTNINITFEAHQIKLPNGKIINKISNSRECITYVVYTDYCYNTTKIDFKGAFNGVCYWKPIFTEEYKNWEEFDKLFKIK